MGKSYYCQSLVGIGHLTSSLLITRELLQHFEVDFIQGGLDTGTVPENPGFRQLRLPTLLHDEETGELYDPDKQRTPEEVWITRAGCVKDFLRWPYHAIIVEFFPFGRRQFKHEILNQTTQHWYTQAASGRG